MCVCVCSDTITAADPDEEPRRDPQWCIMGNTEIAAICSLWRQIKNDMKPAVCGPTGRHTDERVELPAGTGQEKDDVVVGGAVGWLKALALVSIATLATSTAQLCVPVGNTRVATVCDITARHHKYSTVLLTCTSCDC